MNREKEAAQNADGHAIWHIGHRWVLVLPIVIAVVVILLVINQIVTFQAGYSLSARTELVQLELDDQQGEKVQLPDVRLSRSDMDYKRPSLRLLNGAVITMQRLQKGDLRMQVNWPAGGDGARLITAEGKEITLGENESMIISSREGSVTLSFKGMLHLGQQTARDLAGVLLGGRITVAEKVPLKSARYIISDSMLDAGDTPLWLDSSGAPVEVAGFVHVDDDQAMLVVAHADADHVTVQRYGGRDYEISPAWWDRFAHDPYLSCAVAIFGFLSGVALLACEVRKLDWSWPAFWLLPKNTRKSSTEKQ